MCTGVSAAVPACFSEYLTKPERKEAQMGSIFKEGYALNGEGCELTSSIRHQ